MSLPCSYPSNAYLSQIEYNPCAFWCPTKAIHNLTPGDICLLSLQYSSPNKLLQSSCCSWRVTRTLTHDIRSAAPSVTEWKALSTRVSWLIPSTKSGTYPLKYDNLRASCSAMVEVSFLRFNSTVVINFMGQLDGAVGYPDIFLNIFWMINI